MSVEEPSSGRPTGPPSGPLSGRPEPGATPSDGGAGGPDGGDSGGRYGPGGPSGPGGPGPGGPWWRSAPRVAVITTVVVAAVVLAVVFTSSGGGSGSGEEVASEGEVFLQPAGETGPRPFTKSSATDSSAPAETPSATPTRDTNVVRSARGDAPGLYGGTRNRTSCDVGKQIEFLRSAPDRNRAFASVQGIRSSEVPAYLRSLTSLQLRYDTRVTNHGFRDGRAVPYQAVLQTGTAVLVDDRGVPRTRCACGNPLTPPVAQKAGFKETGERWPGYRRQNVVVVQESPTVINTFVVTNPDNGEWFERRKGDTGREDKKTKPPEHTPVPTPSAPTGSPTGKSPSSSSPSAPTTEEPTSEKPTSEKPTTGEPTSAEPTSQEPTASQEPTTPQEPTSQEATSPTEGSPGTSSASGDLTTPDTATAPSPGA